MNDKFYILCKVNYFTENVKFQAKESKVIMFFSIEMEPTVQYFIKQFICLSL